MICDVVVICVVSFSLMLGFDEKYWFPFDGSRVMLCVLGRGLGRDMARAREAGYGMNIR
jgi:hypothetical protein